MQVELDLPEEVVRDLLTVSGTNIVVIADDSSSMSQVSSTTDIYAPKTRWMELKTTLSQLIHMILVIGCQGFKCKFLNDPAFYHITSSDDLDALFVAKQAPRGMTPLGSNLALVLNGYDKKDFPEGE